MNENVEVNETKVTEKEPETITLKEYIEATKKTLVRLCEIEEELGLTND